MKLSKVKRAGSEVQGPKSKVEQAEKTPSASVDSGRWTLGFRLRPSNLGGRDGVALVITLIMLAIITFMAVTFLVLSNRERGSVTTAMDQKTARNASDAGLGRVSAELLSRIMFHTNFQDANLVASTNYINGHGLHTGVPGSLSPTNVNYDYLDTGAPLDSQGHNINIASLLFNPRPPVYVVTNIGTGAAEFRYYLDLNRNGRFDKNGNWPVVVTDSAGLPRYVSTNGTLISTNLPIVPAGTYLVTNAFVGDPEWIGQLARPEELHSADNQFIARYAYIVLPAGMGLDMNTMHNQSVTRTVNPATGPFPADGYYRNQGVGPWELNLAAFLADLNTNIWDANPLFPQNFYQYNEANLPPFVRGPNLGVAFDDARALLSYRYNYDYATLATAAQTFPFAGTGLVRDNIDEYSDGSPMTNIFNIDESVVTPGSPDQVTQPWPGAENTNHYFTTQDPFDKIKVPGFSARLQQAGGSNDSYNAYTYYRMLAQLSTDSTIETNKLNLNFKNTDIHGNIVPGMETNLFPWTATDFFTNAANRILAQVTNTVGVALSTAYIPVYPTNYYTPAIHRALQLAANIFDATTNQTVALTVGQTNAFFPSVFRPIFTSQNGQIWISGYSEVTNLNPLSFQWWDFNTASNNPGTFVGVNIYGVPWVIGAKKGWPNFNQFAVETDYQLTRKLAVDRNSSGPGPATPSDFIGRQMFNMTILNHVGMQAWNSYGTGWPLATRPLQLIGTNIFSVRLLSQTNASGVDLIPYQALQPSGTNYTPATSGRFPGTWGKYRPGDTTQIADSQISLVSTNAYTLLDGNNYSYHATLPKFLPGTNYDQTTLGPPQIYIATTNRVVYALVDVHAQRIVDFVNLDDSGKIIDFTAALAQYSQCNAASTQPLDPASMWCTNRVTGTPVIPDAISQGLDYQIEASLGSVEVSGWNDPNDPNVDPNNLAQIKDFHDLILNGLAKNGVTNQTPYNPVFGITNFISWEANDPMVHYTIPDMTDQNSLNKWIFHSSDGVENHRYLPWNTPDPSGNIDSDNVIQSSAKKDPMMYTSDAWDFPTNRFWNVGILGRVHRGTPWQTVYMKSPIVSLEDWQKWCGSVVTDTNYNDNNAFADASLTQPTDDYRLFDLFTTAIGPSATRGQLNINQTNLAAWSAVLSGVSVLTNANTDGASFQTIGPTVIAPAGIYDTNNPTPVARIWMGINQARANKNPTNNLVFEDGTFGHLGDLLQTPELTVASPYINTNWPANDEVYERIPQQIMSLLTLNQTPRFVIYSFGQTLHPADHSLVIGGTFNGLCTNYQITAESAVRAVVHVEGTPDPKYVNGRVDSQGRTYPPHLVVEQYNVLSPD